MMLDDPEACYGWSLKHIQGQAGGKPGLGNWVSLYSVGSPWFSQCKKMLGFHSRVEVIWTGLPACVD